jgi:hypothetical protein
MERVVEPEILDLLPAGDPAARRSRRDLRLLNALMGNERWLERQVVRHARAAVCGVVELGAGEGRLAARLARRFPVTAVDLAPRPCGLPGQVEWRQGDVLAVLPGLTGGVLVTNLFLHHFEGEALAMLGRAAAGFAVVCGCEPWRVPLAHWLGHLMGPWVNPVTRHDLHASIRAGFRRGELPELLGLAGGGWEWRESADLRGALRLVAGRER